MLPDTRKNSWLDRPLLTAVPGITVEVFLVTIILLLALVSRLYNLGARVMSHDEVNHVVPSYNYSQGGTYQYDPITHGPLQFHMIALSYILFGDGDFTSRLPAAALGIAAIAMVLFAFRRYLGRSGSIVAGLLFVISPYMLFYDRYARNEAYIIMWTLLLLYATLRYLETGRTRYLFLFTFATALQFIDKATSYIFAAEVLLFLALFFIDRISRRKWQHPAALSYFIILLLVTILLAGVAAGLAFANKPAATSSAALAPAVGQATVTPQSGLSAVSKVGMPVAAVLALIAAAGAIYFLVDGLGWAAIRDERSFDLLMLQFTLVLPLLVALPIKILGFDPLDYSSAGIIRAILFILPLAAVTFLLGWWWRGSFWLKCMALFWGIFTIFYTSFFTNGEGFATGLVGALGYWMAQQAVNRGTQPWYYYILTQVPMYEYLSFLGLLLAVYLGLRNRLFINQPGEPHQHAPELSGSLEDKNQPSIAAEVLIDIPAAALGPETVPVSADLEIQAEAAEEAATEEAALPPVQLEPGPRPVPALALIVFWSFSSILAFSIAGEKMPWLTIHIALPMLLSSGWALGYLIDTTHWERLRSNKSWLVILLLALFLASLAGLVVSLLGPTLPFQGKELAQLEVTASFVMSLIVAVLSGASLAKVVVNWQLSDLRRLLVLTFFVFLAVLTARAAFRAAFINYDTAKETLVYAHAARGPKDALAQIEDISYRTTLGKDLVIAYDNDMLYPFWWYLRAYHNTKYFADKPTRDIRNAVVIVAGEANFTKVDAIAGDAYYKFDYIRLWWPMEDYKNLTWQRISNALTNSQLRAGIFDIWLNADYSQYAAATGSKSLTLENWSPANRMRLYIRKDVASQLWPYGVAPVSAPAVADPYEKGKVQLSAAPVITAPGQLVSPRQVALAQDGSLYVADSGAHRILHFAADGTLLQSWGTPADIAQGAAPGGTLNQPWGVAVGKDGSVFVADSWNHRIQKFTSDGKFIKMWGHLGDGTAPDSFYGPRGLAVDAQGRLYVADTGNKRIVIFDADGNYVTKFGEAGVDPGQLDEPVAVAVDKDGLVYVTDTWNQRVQVFQPDASGLLFTPVRQWAISGWYGGSVENKPFITVDSDHVFVTDPEGYRVLEFTLAGDFVHTWGDYGTDAAGIGLAAGIAVDGQGGLWVSDTANSRLLHFSIPTQ